MTLTRTKSYRIVEDYYDKGSLRKQDFSARWNFSYAHRLFERKFKLSVDTYALSIVEERPGKLPIQSLDFFSFSVFNQGVLVKEVKILDENSEVVYRSD